jgi:hypothetical protein
LIRKHDDPDTREERLAELLELFRVRAAEHIEPVSAGEQLATHARELDAGGTMHGRDVISGGRSC